MYNEVELIKKKKKWIIHTSNACVPNDLSVIIFDESKRLLYWNRSLISTRLRPDGYPASVSQTLQLYNSNFNTLVAVLVRQINRYFFFYAKISYIGTWRHPRKYSTFYRRVHPLSHGAHTYRILSKRESKRRFGKRRSQAGLELQNVVDTRHRQGTAKIVILY